MNSKIKRKLLFMLVIVFVIFFLFTKEQKKKVFVQDIAATKLYTDKDLKKVDKIVHEPAQAIEKDKLIPDILTKYEVVKNKEPEVCTKDGKSSIVLSDKNYNIVVVEVGNSYEYFKERNGKCSSLGKIENVNFTDNIVETYANDSIYTNFDSLSNFELTGLIRVNSEGAKPYDSVSRRYSNPTAFSDGVLLVENNRSIVAFDKEDKQIFAQANDSTNRNVLSINLVGTSLFVVVKINKQVFLEAYSMDNTEAIVAAEPNLVYEITNVFSSFDSEFVTKSSAEYGSFTSGGTTLVVKRDFSEIFDLKQADTALAISNNMIYLKYNELYYVVDLKEKEKELIGNPRALNIKVEDKDVYFTILNSQGKEEYIKYKTR